MKNFCECNNCGWYGDEEDLILVEFDINDENETPTATEQTGGAVQRLNDEPSERDFLKGCPECNTDSYLMDIDYKALWVKLGDIPCDEEEDEHIEEEFLHFVVGTHKYDIWDWFEETFNLSIGDKFF
jgi:hypothetical protein